MTETAVAPHPRSTLEVTAARPTIEGAGVHLKRAFGQATPKLDPFLLLDDFRSENPADYVAGFPWHPHRGIETVTYMLDGKVEHGDSMGNKGIIGPGDVQWMTAGSGIIHQEMPKGLDRSMGGFQLWVNLPARQKMMDPRYQEVKSGDIPLVEPTQGARVKVVAGQVAGTRGPVRDIVVEPEYLDISLKPRAAFEHAVPRGHTAFAYLVQGDAAFDPEGRDTVSSEHLIIMKRDGDRVRMQAGAQGARVLLVAGKPLGEPVAWWGPIVMNNRRELEQAIEEYQAGTFIKRGTGPGPGKAPAP
jgi:redox-sensitive bicupin YhaK (pirin superfamily)